MVYICIALDLESLFKIAKEGQKKALSRVNNSSLSSFRIKSAPATVREQKRERNSF